MPYLDSFTHSNKTLNAPPNFAQGLQRMQSQKNLSRSFDEATKMVRSLIARHFAQSGVYRSLAPENVRV